MKLDCVPSHFRPTFTRPQVSSLVGYRAFPGQNTKNLTRYFSIWMKFCSCAGFRESLTFQHHIINYPHLAVEKKAYEKHLIFFLKQYNSRTVCWITMCCLRRCYKIFEGRKMANISSKHSSIFYDSDLNHLAYTSYWWVTCVLTIFCSAAAWGSFLAGCISPLPLKRECINFDTVYVWFSTKLKKLSSLIIRFLYLDSVTLQKCYRRNPRRNSRRNLEKTAGRIHEKQNYKRNLWKK